MPAEAMLITLALVLYTFAIWSEKLRKQGLLWWMVIVFCSGFFCDFVGTRIMIIKAGNIEMTVHGFFGYSALIIMGVHLAWAILAIFRHGKAEQYFRRHSVKAWALWLIAFFTGGIGAMLQN